MLYQSALEIHHQLPLSVGYTSPVGTSVYEFTVTDADFTSTYIFNIASGDTGGYFEFDSSITNSFTEILNNRMFNFQCTHNIYKQRRNLWYFYNRKHRMRININ
jgi:hypothetical protein